MPTRQLPFSRQQATGLLELLRKPALLLEFASSHPAHKLDVREDSAPEIPSPAPENRSSRLRRGFLFFKEYGIRQTAVLIQKNIAFYLRRYFNHRFDRKFHVDTSGVISLADLTCDSVNKSAGNRYEATPIRSLKRIFSVLPLDLHEFTFIDFGSGKGRTLLFASNYNFRRIIGVEFAQELHAVAQENIKTYTSRMQKCFDLASVCADAATFSLPPDENCVLYFFAPFRYDVTSRVFANIKASYEQNPRQIIVLYGQMSPACARAIQELGFLNKRDEWKMPFDLSAEPCAFRRTFTVFET